METVRDFILGCFKITADGDCSHEIKRPLLLGRKDNLDSILKSRDITLPTNVHLLKAMVFPVVMYGCESWTVKKAECWRIDAFKLWCWRRLLRVPWTARRSNQSILKEISSEYSLEDWYWSWNANPLATWCEELTHLKRPWCWERLKAGGEADDRGWGGWMASLTQWTWIWVNSRSWWWTGKPGMLQSMGSQKSDMTEQLNWIDEVQCADKVDTHWFRQDLGSCYSADSGFLVWTRVQEFSSILPGDISVAGLHMFEELEYIMDADNIEWTKIAKSNRAGGQWSYWPAMWLLMLNFLV